MKNLVLGVLAAIATLTGGKAAAVEPVDLIVRGDHVVTMAEGSPILRDGAVAIQGGEIIAVGSSAEIAERYQAAATLDGTDRIVMPGLVNGHTHAAMVLFRGIADDLDLMTWLNQYIFPMEGRFVDEEFVRIGAELACLEMIRGGTTSFVDMYFYPEVSTEVFSRCGLRAVIGAPMIDFPSPGFEGWDDSFRAGIEFVERQKGKHSRIRPAFAPHAAYTVSPDHLRDVLSAARALEVPITIHVSEDRKEIAQIEEQYGKTPVRHLADLGLLDHALIAAHMVWPTETDMVLLAESRACAIHNPTSNLKTAAGVSPVPQMLRRGIRIGLGTDGAASNNDLDMWEEMRLAALLHKGVSGDPTLVPAETALDMATRGGAIAVGLDDVVGTIAPGKRADIIQVSLSRADAAPLYDVISHLVYVLDATDVTTTIVDGEILMRDRKLLTLDADKVRANVQKKAAEIQEALNEN